LIRSQMRIGSSRISGPSGPKSYTGGRVYAETVYRGRGKKL
jgi:hypothetical protein